MKSLGRWFPLPLWLLLCILPHNCFPRSNLIFSFLPASIHYVFSAWNILFVCSFKCQLSYHYPCKISDSTNLGSMHDLPAKHSWSPTAYMFFFTHCNDEAFSVYLFCSHEYKNSVFFLCILVSLNSSIIKTQLLCHIREWIFICK